MTEMQPKQWTIDEPRLEDAEDLAHMHAQSWRDTYLGIQESVDDEWVEARASERETAEGIERYVSQIEAASGDLEHRFYKVARDRAEKAVGFVSASKNDDEQELTGFYIDKSFQGSGVASAMGVALMDWLNPTKDTHLWVAVNNDRAIHFYEKLGFQLQPSTEKEFGGGLMEIQMIKSGDKNEV